jgi:hypothetical protein
MSDEKTRLPVIPEYEGEDQELAACSPRIYVSNEEAAVLGAMRTLRERSLELRRALDSADEGDRPPLESELENLRSRWRALAKRREEAFRRKMIMLGHLPPDEDDWSS